MILKLVILAWTLACLNAAVAIVRAVHPQLCARLASWIGLRTSILWFHLTKAVICMDCRRVVKFPILILPNSPQTHGLCPACFARRNNELQAENERKVANA